MHRSVLSTIRRLENNKKRSLSILSSVRITVIAGLFIGLVACGGEEAGNVVDRFVTFPDAETDTTVDAAEQAAAEQAAAEQAAAEQAAAEQAAAAAEQAAAAEAAEQAAAAAEQAALAAEVEAANQAAAAAAALAANAAAEAEARARAAEIAREAAEQARLAAAAAASEEAARLAAEAEAARLASEAAAARAAEEAEAARIAEEAEAARLAEEAEAARLAEEAEAARLAAEAEAARLAAEEAEAARIAEEAEAARLAEEAEAARIAEEAEAARIAEEAEAARLAEEAEDAQRRANEEESRLQSLTPGPLDTTGWVLSSEDQRARVRFPIDGDPATRWATSEAQHPGQFLSIDFGRLETFDTLQLFTDKIANSPRGYAIFVSEDGANFGEPVAADNSVSPGFELTISFEQVTGRFLRIEQTELIEATDPNPTPRDKYWWAISELIVSLAPEAPEISIERGRVLYEAQCARCHGDDASGGTSRGIDLTVDVYTHVSTGDTPYSLEDYTELFMPRNRAGECVGQCAVDIANYLRELAQPAIRPISDSWQQAQGPNGNYSIDGEAVESFSVTHDENILWKTDLPSTGQGAVIIAGNKAFVMSHISQTQNQERGTETVAQAFDASTGELLWERELTGTRNAGLSQYFGDNTAYSPVANDSYVAFINAGGTVTVYDHEGTEQWTRTWDHSTHNSGKLHEPMLIGDQLIVFRTIKDLPREGTDRWTHLHSYDFATGELNWVAEDGTSSFSTSMMGVNALGEPIITTGRGGAHSPLERPYGVSVISALDGKTIWQRDFNNNYWAHQNVTFDSKAVYPITRTDQVWLDIETGEQLRARSLTEGVTVTSWNGNRYVTEDNVEFDNGHRNRPLTYQTNVVVGDYQYFRPTTRGYIGRIDLVSGDIEYLQVPVQIERREGQPDRTLWNTPIRMDMLTSNGFRAANNNRNQLHGWGHQSGPAPLAVGDRIYVPTVTGMVYVIDGLAENFDETALLNISDLGPAEGTWALSSFSYADGTLFVRTMKELIAIGVNDE